MKISDKIIAYDAFLNKLVPGLDALYPDVVNTLDFYSGDEQNRQYIVAILTERTIEFVTTEHQPDFTFNSKIDSYPISSLTRIENNYASYKAYPETRIVFRREEVLLHFNNQVPVSIKVRREYEYDVNQKLNQLEEFINDIKSKM